MILLVDIGNSRIKWVCLDEPSLDAVGDTVHCQTSIDAFHVIGEALPSDISQVMATNVAGKSHELALVSVCTERWGISPEFVTPDNDKVLIKSCENINNVEVIEASSLNAYALIRPKNLVISVDAVEKIHDLWGEPDFKTVSKSAAPAKKATSAKKTTKAKTTKAKTTAKKKVVKKDD